MAIIRCNPMRDMAMWNIHEIDRMVDEFTRGGTVADAQFPTWLPDVDIVEHESEYRVNLELPGVKKEDVKITVMNDVLTVKGEKKEEKETKGKNYRRNERSYGAFQRSFMLPTLVKSDQIEASYDSGILTLTLPKMEEAKPKEIEVKVK